MEEQAQNLLVTLKKSSVATDAKLVAFNNLKSNIKHLRVPEAAQPTIFECIKFAITSQASTTLVSSGFSTLGHLIKRLSLQEQTSAIAAHAKRFLPVLLDRLGDTRESHRSAAAQSLSDFWPYCHAEVEQLLRDGALGGHNARAKESAMLWVVKMNKSESLQFKAFVPQLVASLEDPDGTVRETAKGCVVELFRNAPDHAKTDLKKRMIQQGVRKTIEAQVVSQLGIRASVDLDLAASVRPIAPAHTDHAPAESNFGDSVMSEQPPPQETVPMDPLYVDTQRELEGVFQDMLPLFEGRESEGNWSARDKNVLKLRRLLKGNGPTEFPLAFVAGIKSVMDGIIKVANSLRTTVSTNGCLCVQELARALGPALDPMVEILIQNFIKTSAATKKIAADNGNKTVESILSHVSYTTRLMQHMWMSIQDKNVQTRSYASGWLAILIKKHAHQKSQIEHSGGLEVAEKFINKGLADANPKVREGTRATYWAFAQVWQDQADGIMNSLDAKSRGQLEKDTHNPNGGSLASSVSSLAASTTSKPGLPPGRKSIRDAIAAQRKAAANTARLPERPSSAQSSFSPVKPQSSTAAGARPAVGRAATARPPSTSSRDTTSGSQASQISTTSSLMSAPVRRPRRPEIARPATADPYAASRRTAAERSTPTMSPQTSPQKPTVKSTVKAAATRTPARPQAPSSSSTVRPKSRMESGIPRQTPRRPTTTDSPLSTASNHEDLTMVVPFTNAPDDDEAHGPPSRKTPRLNKTMSVDSGIPGIDEDGNFTMVIPNLRGQPFDERPTSSGSQQRFGTPRISPIKSSANSPLHFQRLLSPAARSPERSKIPLVKANLEPDVEPVQIYEDPYGNDETPTQSRQSEQEKPVLEELPLDGRANERLTSEEAPVLSEFSDSTRSNEQNVARMPRHHKTTSTGSILGTGESNGGVMQNAETLRSRKLLTSGIERIRAKTLDVHGFRRVQDLVKGKEDIWGNEGQKFGELLLALLDYLEAPNDGLKAGGPTKAQSLKTQVLATVRAMLTLHRKEAAPYYSRALCSVLATRRQFEESMHITSDIEKTADDIVKYGQPLDSLNAVLDLLESLNPTPSSPSSTSSGASDTSSLPILTQEPGCSSSRTIVMSLSVLGSLLAAAQSRSVPVSQSQTQRLGQVAVRFLHDSDSDVRRSDLEFCLVLYDRLGGERGEGFWKAVGGVKEGHMNLITYYLARKGKAVQV